MKITFEGTLGEILDQIDGFMRRLAVKNEPVEKSIVLEDSIEPAESQLAPGPEPEPQGPGPEEVEPVKGKPRATKVKPKAPTPVFDPNPEPSPAEMVKIRQKTIEELQAAYSSGKQKVVFELLSKHGNGAKSFRELTPEAFKPIRKAIDEGALL